MTPQQALALVRKYGVMMESARGDAPCLAEAIVGGPIRGSWWSHPRGREVFHVLQGVRASSEVLVCRLARGKVTFVHRRVWPALVRLAGRYPVKHLARIEEVHSPSGRHEVKETPFPKWVPDGILKKASELNEEKALEQLGSPGAGQNRPRSRK